MGNAKPVWASKTLWVNGLSVVAALLAAFGAYHIDAELQGEIVAVVMGAANIALRFVTRQPVELPGRDA